MAKKLFMYDIDLMQNQLINAVTENRSSAPENPVAGQRYFDTVDKLEKVFDGTNWLALATGGDTTALTQRVTALETKTTQDEIEAKDTSVTVTPNSNGVKTKVGVNIRDTSNDIKLGQDGIYSEPYTGDNATVEISNAKQISVKANVFDAYGDAAAAEAAAKSYADTKKAEVIGDASSTSTSDTVKGAKKYAEETAADAQSAAESYADTKKSEVIGNASTDTAASDTINGAKKYADSVASDIESDLIGASTDPSSADTIYGAKKKAEEEAAAAQSAAEATAAADATSKANAAEAAAKSYADTKKTEAISAAATDATTKADAAEAAAKAYTDSELQALDANLSSSGKYAKQITQVDGQVGAVFETVQAGEVSVSDPNDHFTGSTVEAVLEELYSQSGAGSTVTVEEVNSGLDGSILKAYKIWQGDTSVPTNLKGTINIPKDLVVTSGSVVTGTWNGSTFTEDATQPGSGTGKALKLVIANQQAPVYINVLDLVKDHTGGNGINISNDNVISIVLDPTTETFLTLGANGLKLSGVQTAIDTAEQNAKDYADSAIDDAISDVDDYTVNNKKISTSPVLNGADILLTGYQKAASANQSIAATDTVNQAIGKLEKEVEENEEVTAQALNDLDSRVDDLESDNTTYKGYVDTLRGSASTPGSVAKGDADTLAAAQTYADTKKAEAIAAAESDATTKANTAEQNANDYTDTAIAAAVGSGVHTYSTSFTSGNSGSIQAATHKCGTVPMVTTYLSGQEVDCAVSIDASGNVSIAWNGAGVTAQTPLTVKIVG